VIKQIRKLGPGLLFASSAVGTSHLVLSTRAGAHYGLSFLWIILLCLLLKYPFYDFGARYTAVTGESLIKAYCRQSLGAFYIFFAIILINMFAVTAAVGGVSAGLLQAVGAFHAQNINTLLATLIIITALILSLGGFRLLDKLIKLVSLCLIVSVVYIFFIVLINGPPEFVATSGQPSIFSGAALALLVSLLGWMPSGMEASVLHSIWVMEKQNISASPLEEKDVLADFRLGYIITSVLAIVFLLIGAFTVYGTGVRLEGNSVEFSKALLDIFVDNLGKNAQLGFGVAAFLTIYGTYIVVVDAFSRAFLKCLNALMKTRTTQTSIVLKKDTAYKITVIAVSIGAYLLFVSFASSMLYMLHLATSMAFVFSPVIAYLNYRSMIYLEENGNYRLPVFLKYLSWIGLLALGSFAIYYISSLIMS
jgi:Mn2+/Fe2+ NRAMP family transporter